MHVMKLSLLAIAVVIFAIACGQPAANTTTENDGKKMAPINSASAGSPANIAPANTTAPKDEVAQASELYTKNCMTCHKDNGNGGKVTVDGKNLDVKDLTGDRMKQRTDEKLTRDISEGAVDDGMPAFKGKLKPEEIALVVKHVRALQAK